MVIWCQKCGAPLEHYYYRAKILYPVNGSLIVLGRLRVCEKCLLELKQEFRGKAKARYRKVKVKEKSVEKKFATTHLQIIHGVFTSKNY